MKIKILLVIVIAALTVVVFFALQPKPSGTNDSMSMDDFSGDIFHFQPVTISPDIAELSVRFIPGPSLKFVPDTTPKVFALSNDNSVISLEPSDNVNPDSAFVFPMRARPGMTDVLVDYKVFCCTRKDAGICFFREGRIIVPVEVVASGGLGTFEIVQTIDE